MRRTAPVKSSKTISRKKRRLSRQLLCTPKLARARGKEGEEAYLVRLSFRNTNEVDSNAILARGVVALQSNEFAVQPRLIHQLVVCAKLGDLSALHYDDAVRSANGRETVGHDK